MSQTYSEPRVVCRPALAADTADILEFTKNIWEGHDYIHYVWSDWLDDPQGLLAVAQYGAHAVGMAKASLVSPGQWWLEGFRVNPNFQGLKIGSHLHEYMDAWWLKHGDGTLRLMTSSQRVQVHHLCERTGYVKVGEVLGWRFPPAPDEAGANPPAGAPQVGAPHGLKLARLEDVPEALAFASAHLPGSSILMDSGWRFSLPDAATLAQRVDLGRLHWWRGRLGLLATHEDDDEEGRVLAIGFAAVAEPPLLSDLLRDAHLLARQEGFAYVHWLAPVDDSIQAALRQAGYVVSWDNAGFLYQKPHPGS